jgi:hypothetical protein
LFVGCWLVVICWLFSFWFFKAVCVTLPCWQTWNEVAAELGDISLEGELYLSLRLCCLFFFLCLFLKTSLLSLGMKCEGNGKGTSDQSHVVQRLFWCFVLLQVLSATSTVMPLRGSNTCLKCALCPIHRGSLGCLFALPHVRCINNKILVLPASLKSKPTYCWAMFVSLQCHFCALVLSMFVLCMS